MDAYRKFRSLSEPLLAQSVTLTRSRLQCSGACSRITVTECCSEHVAPYLCRSGFVRSSSPEHRGGAATGHPYDVFERAD